MPRGSFCRRASRLQRGRVHICTSIMLKKMPNQAVIRHNSTEKTSRLTLQRTARRKPRKIARPTKPVSPSTLAY